MNHTHHIFLHIYHYLTNTDVLVYVVDSADRDRLKESGEIFHQLLNEPKLRDARVLIFANKSDIPGCLTEAEIAEGLRLDIVKEHTWRIQTCSAIRNSGIREGFDWIISDNK